MDCVHNIANSVIVYISHKVGNTEACQLLVAAGASVNAMDYQTGEDSIHVHTCRTVQYITVSKCITH